MRQAIPALAFAIASAGRSGQRQSRHLPPSRIRADLGIPERCCRPRSPAVSTASATGTDGGTDRRGRAARSHARPGVRHCVVQAGEGGVQLVLRWRARRGRAAAGHIQSMAGGRFVLYHESAAVAQQPPACSDMFTVADGNWPITVIHGSMRAEAGVPATVETHPSNLMRVMPP